MSKLAMLCIGILGLGFCTGCTTKAHLGYHPIIEKQAPNHIKLAVQPFEDQRQNVEQVGSIKNLYGMTIIKVKTDDSVPDWMSTALKTELSSAGYTIVDVNETSDYSIEGEIIKVHAQTYFVYHGRMKVILSLKEGDQTIFQKEYATKKSGGVNWMASPAQCMNTLEYNLHEVCRQFIEDLKELPLQVSSIQASL